MWKRIGPVLAAVLAMFVLTGAGQVGRPLGGPEDTSAAHAVAVLTGLADGDLSSSVPVEFEQVIGYRPHLVHGRDGTARLTEPGSRCSSPVGPTAYDFTRECLTNDYGYDLLRYANARGGALGPWARVAIDDMLGDDLRRRCATLEAGHGCRAAAAIAERAVALNSWRQGQSSPSVEDPAPYAAALLLLGSALALPPAISRVRRRSTDGGTSVAPESRA